MLLDEALSWHKRFTETGSMKNNLFFREDDENMAYENLKAQIAEYNKLCDEKCAKPRTSKL